jgi:flagellar biogenesis protein FliO
MSNSPRRPIGPICGCLLLLLCAAVYAGDAPATGVRLPAGGILEKQDPRLAEPVAPPVKPEGVAKTPVSDEAQGPSAAAGPTSIPSSIGAAGGSVALRTSETKQLVHRGSASAGAVKASGDVQNTGHRAAETWHMWDALPLTVVLVLIAIVALVIKKYMPAKRMLTGAGAMDVVARLPLSGKQSLLLVKVGRRLVLVGVSPEQMASLAVVDDADQVAAIVGRVAGGRSDSISNSFADALGDETQAYAEEPEVNDPSSAAGGCVRNLLDKVRQLTRKQEVA